MEYIRVPRVRQECQDAKMPRMPRPRQTFHISTLYIANTLIDFLIRLIARSIFFIGVVLVVAVDNSSSLRKIKAL